MTTREYPNGVTCWIDHDSADLPAASRFYADLLGWSVEVVTPDAAPVPYALATLDGEEAGGLSGPAPGPAAWHTYVAVDDLETACRRVLDAGGAVTAEPADVGPDGTAGRSASCADPEGVGFRLWQARDRVGVQAVNRPGAWNFSNLHTADPDAAVAFYTDVFGWRVVDQGWGRAIQVPGYGAHLAATADPDILERQTDISAPEGFADVIGAMVPLEQSGGEPGWRVVMTVADRDAAAAQATSLGATVVGAMETEWTREAFVVDPLGALVTLSELTAPDDAA